MALSELRFRLLHALSHVLPEIDVSDPLLHHEVDRVDCVLNVVRLGPEQVANRRHPVALLSLANVLEVVHEASDLHLLLVFGVIQCWLQRMDGLSQAIPSRSGIVAQICVKGVKVTAHGAIVHL